MGLESLRSTYLRTQNDNPVTFQYHFNNEAQMLLSYIIQGDLWLTDLIAGDDFLGLCVQKSSCKHVSDFGRLQSCGHLKLRTESKDSSK